MDISNDLISKFIKTINNQNDNRNKSKEGTVYGTTVMYEGQMYVKLDGSEQLTPVNTTADLKENERVSVTIKDHSAIVMGNITSPSASSGDVKIVNATVNNGKTNWDNAYNRVIEWAYGAVTDSTTIDGGLIQTNTITADKIAANAISGKNITGCTISGGTVTGSKIIGNGSGNRILINNGDYEVQTGNTTKGFFGIKNLDDGYEICRLAMSHSGINPDANDYYTVNAYPPNQNPMNSNNGYIDMGYRCQSFKASNGRGDVSNIRMISDGDIRIAPIKNLEIYSSYNGGAYTGGDEKICARIGSANSSYFDTHIQTGAIRGWDGGDGLLFAHYNGSDATFIRVICTKEADGSVFRALSPKLSSGNIRLGSPSYPWYRCYATVAESVTSDRRKKDNIQYINETINPNAPRSIEYTLEDMYNFVKDDLSLATYTMKDDDTNDLKYGFIAQDIVDTKVGFNIIDQNNTDDYVGYDTMNYTNALAGALKQAINEIEKLKREIDELKNGGK